MEAKRPGAGGERDTMGRKTPATWRPPRFCAQVTAAHAGPSRPGSSAVWLRRVLARRSHQPPTSAVSPAASTRPPSRPPRRRARSLRPPSFHLCVCRGTDTGTWDPGPRPLRPRWAARGGTEGTARHRPYSDLLTARGGKRATFPYGHPGLTASLSLSGHTLILRMRHGEHVSACLPHPEGRVCVGPSRPPHGSAVPTDGAGEDGRLGPEPCQPPLQTTDCARGRGKSPVFEQKTVILESLDLTT